MAYRESMIIKSSATQREKYYMHNSLVAIPLMLINRAVLIDLRNETSVAGRIVDVDGYMNINLKESVFIDQKGLQYEFDDFMVPARQIRQIHLPDSVPIVPELKRFLDAIGSKVRPKMQGKSFKVQKAQKMHQQIVDEAFKK